MTRYPVLNQSAIFQDKEVHVDKSRRERVLIVRERMRGIEKENG